MDESIARTRWTEAEDRTFVAAWEKAAYLNDMQGVCPGRELAALAARAGTMRRNGVALKKLKMKPAYKPNFKALAETAGVNGSVAPAEMTPMPGKAKK